MQQKSYAGYNHPASDFMHHERILLFKSSDSPYGCKCSQNSSSILSTKHPQGHTTLIISAFWFLNLVLQCKYSAVKSTSLVQAGHPQSRSMSIAVKYFLIYSTLMISIMVHLRVPSISQSSYLRTSRCAVRALPP